MGQPKVASRQGVSLIQGSSGKNYPGSQELNSVKDSSALSTISVNAWARPDALFMVGNARVPHAVVGLGQYRGTVPSTWVDQASIPPTKFFTFGKPC
jgi:hypothetical protein